MSILNDREIRQLCLVPTHQRVDNNMRRTLYSLVGDELYCVGDGYRDDVRWKGGLEEAMVNLKELTADQARGYAGGGCLVPTSTAQLKDLEIDDWDATEIDQLKQLEAHPQTPEGNRAHYKQIRERLEKLVAAHAPVWGRMITPYVPGQVRTHYRHVPTGPGQGLQEEVKIISYGTSSMGYDVRLGRKFKIFTNVFSEIIDPLNMPEKAYVDHEGDYVVIPPNSYVLGHTIEYFRMPEDVVAICVGKSTYARAGCAINVTPIEPGFHGNVVIEIANQTPLPMKVYSDMGIAQFMFFRGDPCEISYAKRAGKYQGQTGITTARV